MKSCPTCNRTFEDTLTYCLIDGAILSAPFDPHATLIISEPRQTEPPPTEVLKLEETKQEIPPTIAGPLSERKPEVLASTIAAPAFKSPEQKAAATQPARKSSRSLLFAFGLGAVLVAGLIIFITSSRSGGSSESAASANTRNATNTATASTSNQTGNAGAESMSPAERHAAKAEELSSQMKLKEAAEEYRKAVNLEPNNPKWHRKVGGVLFAGGNVAEAEAALKEAIRLEPNESEYHLMLATVLDKVGEMNPKRDAEAEAEFREAIRLARPDSVFAPTYHWWLGQFFEKRGKYEQAELAYREAIRIAPQEKTRLPYLANVLEKQGKIEEAQAVREKAKQ